MTDYRLTPCDVECAEHLQALVQLLQHYMADPMGDHRPLTPREELRLVDGLTNHPGAWVVLLETEGRYIGMATCFELFSTFQVKPYLYVHDVVVNSDYRGKGCGRLLLEGIVEEARTRGCCKVTLEVRHDNTVAKQLYRTLGFGECDPLMHFWTKILES
jgi:ribosomal protein S18 acetylase RimI-like enzyme